MCCFPFWLESTEQRGDVKLPTISLQGKKSRKIGKLNTCKLCDGSQEKGEIGKKKKENMQAIVIERTHITLRVKTSMREALHSTGQNKMYLK